MPSTLVTRVAASAVSVLALAALITACAHPRPIGGAPTPAPTTTAPPTTAPPTTAPPTTTPVHTPSHGITTTTRFTLPPPIIRGDLTIHFVAHGCTWYQDVPTHNLWIAPTLAAGWTGPGAFPPNAFNMKTSPYGKATAGGPVTSTTPFVWAIGGEPASGNSLLGHTVIFTANIDPVHTVAESNETNNSATLTVAVPSTPPPSSGTVVDLPC